MNVGAEIDQIKSLIEEIESLMVNWGWKYTNQNQGLKWKIQSILGLIIEFDRGEICMKLKVGSQL